MPVGRMVLRRLRPRRCVCGGICARLGVVFGSYPTRRGAAGVVL